MSTRCTLAVEHNGTIASVLVLRNGGPNAISKRLLNEFNKTIDVLNLCSLICLSTIDDRSEVYLGEQMNIHDSIDEWRSDVRYGECDYYYILDSNLVWNIVHDDGKVEVLSEYLNTIDASDNEFRKPKVISFNEAKEKLKVKRDQELLDFESFVVNEEFDSFVEDVVSEEIAEFAICAITHDGDVRIYISANDFISAIGMFEFGKSKIVNDLNN